MSNFSMTEYVCLVSKDELKALRETNSRKHRYDGIGDHLWRQVAISASSEQVCIRLGNVNEEGANGGYIGCWTDTRTIKLGWDDILDRDGLAMLFNHEQVVVFQKVDSMLDVLREHMRALRAVLCAA